MAESIDSSDEEVVVKKRKTSSSDAEEKKKQRRIRSRRKTQGRIGRQSIIIIGTIVMSDLSIAMV